MASLGEKFKNIFANGVMGDGPAEQEKKLAAFIKQRVQDTRSASSRISHEGIWMTNIAYCLGFDSVYYDTTVRQFKVVGRANQQLVRSRLHINKILPTLQNRLARLTKSRPKFQVRPESSEQQDKDAARLGDQILDMLWQKEEMAKKIIDLFMWVQQCGHAYLKTCWDPTLGKVMSDPETGEIEFEGDVRVDVVSPFEVFPDPLAKTFRECQWVVQAKIRKLDYFRTHYPEKGNQVKEEGVWLLSAQYEGRINSLNVQGPSQSGIDQVAKNSAIELIYYEKRSRKHPNGRMVVVANDIVLEDKELPLGEFPFVKFDDIIVAGKYYSEAVVTHLRPIQDQYNRLINKRAQWTNKLLAGKYLVARGSNLTAESLNDQSGEVLEYNNVPNAAQPQSLDIPVMPAYAYQEEERLSLMYDDVSGLNEVSRGQPPGGITAAIGLQYLAEQDDTRIGIMSRRHELGLAQFGRLLLIMVERFYQTPRLLKIAGQNMDYQVKEFLGADLKGNTDVSVVEGSTLPGSITAKRDFILTLYNQGLLGDPADPKTREKVLKQIEFGDVASVWEDYSLDMHQIRRTLDQLENGEPMDPPNEFDNNELHFIEKNKYRKGDKFKALSVEQQELLLADMENRLTLVMEKENPELAQRSLQVAQDEAALQETLAQQQQGVGLPTEDELLTAQDEGLTNQLEVEGL